MLRAEGSRHNISRTSIPACFTCMPWCCEDDLVLLAALNFKIDGPYQVTDFPRLRALAKLHELTAYDVAYLDLAKRMPRPPSRKESKC